VWTPQDLTNQDVACLYSAQADGWTVIDEFGKSGVSHYNSLSLVMYRSNGVCHAELKKNLCLCTW